MPYRPQSAEDAALGAHFALGLRQRHWLRARTLRNLRWIAITGQLMTVLVARYGLGYDFPMIWCLAVILASVWFNVITMITMPPNARLSERTALLWMLFDLGQLGLLLGLTGGLSNPFALLFIAPATVAAAALTRSNARLVVGIAILSIFLLELANLPLSHPEYGTLILPETYLLGIGCALIIGVGFIAIYVRRVADEAFGMSQALAATQLALAREQRLSALGTMAAAAAHELGSPLATIALTAREMERDLERDALDPDDLALIREQTTRCRDILGELSRIRQEDMEHIRTAPLLSVLEEAAGPHGDSGKRIEYFIDGEIVEGKGAPSPIFPRRPEIIHALRNLIQNAVDFARTTVWIEIVETDDVVAVHIQDDGPGYAPDVIDRLGDPYLTTRRGKREHDGGYEGMGLGLFIAKTLLERRGATITFSNRRQGRDALSGAVVEIRWSKEALAPPADPGDPVREATGLGSFGW